MRHNIAILASVATIAAIALSCQKQDPQSGDEEHVRTDVMEQGFYKDLFMDGGIRLTHRTTLPSAETLKLSMEFLATSTNDYESAVDTAVQRAVMSDSNGEYTAEDENGALLYPDGEPRFKMIYMNGGKSTQHATSMLIKDGCQGIERIRQFYYNGGGYLGTCAGAFMTGTGYDEKESYVYLRICTFKPKHTNVEDDYMDMTFESNCPLLKYGYTFGSDNKVAEIRHNGGCYANEGLCAGAQALMRYSTAGHSNVNARNCNGKIGSWEYKRDIYSGRICAIGSHPESITSGERLDLMCAFEKYIFDGTGIATMKDTLTNGKVCALTKSTSDNDPQHTKIGDLQNHHFALWVPEGAKNLTITLQRLGGETYEDCELNLYVKKGSFAFKTEKLDAANIGDEDYKSTTFTTPEKGLYYVCVNCATTVTSTKTTYSNGKGKTGTYYKYTGHTEVLNGVPYTIKATWE